MLGFELTFSPEVAIFATTGTQTNLDRPSSINSWLANTTTPPATSPAPRQSAQSSARPLSAKVSTREKQHNRLSLNFLKRGPSAVPAHQANHAHQVSVAATEKAQDKEIVQPTTNRQGNGNGANGNGLGNGNRHSQEQERVQSPAHLTTRSEDKLQKYFGIPHGQYRVMSPTHDDVAATTNNGDAKYYASGGDLERPETRQSGVSVESSHNGHIENAGPTGAFAGSRMGSVKKRLSLLGMGIGKKASKSSVRSRGQVESLTEE